MVHWPEEEKLRHLLALPWTIIPETTPEGDRLLRVQELPAAVGCGSTDEELEADFWDSLTATLSAYLHFGDPIPLPAGVTSLPWDSPAPMGTTEVNSPSDEAAPSAPPTTVWVPVGDHGIELKAETGPLVPAANQSKVVDAAA